ncbi:hypothetical protein [Gramella sp. AN32]|uniref:Uncharacterized protein n=1 Tax=Christiangramia antarctica TaxID=2058158 RepID=A0ABW5XA30_9FLAO|nr:hypothetical protein [Gramella sp. AN32]MCM4156531.1 hypothetical protein [Gramella sp. AN32]
MKENKNIWPDKSGFNIPTDYFANMEEQILSKISEENYIITEKNESGFKVPEAYFDNIEDSILQKIGSPIQVDNQKNEYLYMAAAIAAVVLLYFGINIEKSSTSLITWDSVELSAIENYIDEGYDMGYIDLNTPEYSEFLDVNNILVTDEDFKEVNEDVALDYIEGNLDNSDFILE